MTYVTATVSVPPAAECRYRFCPATATFQAGGASIAGDTGEADDTNISTMQPADSIDGDSVTNNAWIADASNDDNVSHALTTAAVYVETSRRTSPTSNRRARSEQVAYPAAPPRGSGKVTSGGLGSDSSSSRPDRVGGARAQLQRQGSRLQRALGSDSRKEAPAIDVTTFGLTTEALEHRCKTRIIFGPGLEAKCPKGTRVLRRLQPLPKDLIASAPFDGKDATARRMTAGR